MQVKIVGDKLGAGKRLSGTYTIPGDKSISHRSVILGAMAKGITEVKGFLTGEDCLSTIRCFQLLGVEINLEGTSLTINSSGSFSPPLNTLDVGNSGTTLRLVTGLLAGQVFNTTITGDASLQKRPMERVTIPLSLMGSNIIGKYAPISIKGRQLKGINYTLPVASAQVKSAILLAGLYAEGETIIEEPIPTRDHTEIMLKYFGADIAKKGNLIISRRASTPLKPQSITIPGDISSAAFLMVAASILPKSRILIKDVGVNPTRTGIIHVLKRMGADIRFHNERVNCGEAIADIEIRYAPLKATIISGVEIPTLIDEIPAIAVAALFAEGKTIIKNAQELRVKETDRIQTISEELSKFFDKTPIIPKQDGMVIQGGFTLNGAEFNSHGDHRLAMSLAIAALAAQGDSMVCNSQCVDISFPGFFQILQIHS
ncbi:MAG: 3-phosphoshikimate 1-carboxyvinyltransferase [Defluviitaleaceae bacterium]|nr:3-phosphoshikimate 1-carboxyvinyltransferase [Defluviitaleaceae bacterium]